MRSGQRQPVDVQQERLAGRSGVEETLAPRLLEIGRTAGLAAIGITTAEVQEPARTVLASRKARELSGTMQFTYRNPERSTDPTRHLPSARSMVVGALAYASTPSDDESSSWPGLRRPTGRVARYVRDDSYQRLAGALEAVADELRSADYRAVVVADSNHLVDRNAAWRAGLGWYGKNSNLLVPEVGSWVVLGSVLTDAVLAETGPPMGDGCGRCQACMVDCPTGAIVAPGVVDAARCIAWLVQAAEPIPRHLRAAVGDRMYGCDDCQEVCPVGSGDDGTAVAVDLPNGATTGGLVDVLDVLSATDAELLDRFGHWYIANRDPNVIRRTALVVLGNAEEVDDVAAIRSVLKRNLTSGESQLVAHAVWAAAQLGLEDLIPAELWQSNDALVLDELHMLGRNPARQSSPDGMAGS